MRSPGAGATPGLPKTPAPATSRGRIDIVDRLAAAPVLCPKILDTACSLYSPKKSRVPTGLSRRPIDDLPAYPSTRAVAKKADKAAKLAFVEPFDGIVKLLFCVDPGHAGQSARERPRPAASF